MRIVAIILAFVVIFLSCLPCADVGEPMPFTDTKTEVGKKNNHEHKDECSPFCHCACCASFCVTKAPFVFSIAPQEQIVRAYTAHFIEAVHEISLPVWQPPQLV